jgi:uncharacterized FlaG/YvyC family protein
MSELSGVSGLSSIDAELARQVLAPQQAAPSPVQLPGVPRATQPGEKPLSQDEKKSLDGAVEHLDQVIKPLDIGLNIRHIDSLDRFAVELFDRETGKVIREIPARQVIQMQENMKQMQGLIFDKFS